MCSGVDTCTCSAAGVARLTRPVHGVVVVTLRARGEAAAFFPQVDQTQSAAQAVVVLAAAALAAAGVTRLTHS